MDLTSIPRQAKRLRFALHQRIIGREKGARFMLKGADRRLFGRTSPFGTGCLGHAQNYDRPERRGLSIAITWRLASIGLYHTHRQHGGTAANRLLSELQSCLRRLKRVVDVFPVP